MLEAPVAHTRAWCCEKFDESATLLDHIADARSCTFLLQAQQHGHQKHLLDVGVKCSNVIHNQELLGTSSPYALEQLRHVNLSLALLHDAQLRYI